MNEDADKNHLKELLISFIKESKEPHDIDRLISDLKAIGMSPIQTIFTLTRDLGYQFQDAKNKVFDSPVWVGLREQSEELTQMFLDAAAADADEVEKVDGRIVSIKIDLTKDRPEDTK